MWTTNKASTHTPTSRAKILVTTGAFWLLALFSSGSSKELKYDVQWKLTATLSLERKAWKVTDQEYQEVLTPLIRSDIIEEVRLKLFPDLTFSSAESKNLRVNDITREHIVVLLGRIAETFDEQNNSNLASIYPLLLVGARGEWLITSEIFENQKVIVTLPKSEVSPQNTILPLFSPDDIIPRSINTIEYRGEIFIRKKSESKNYSERKVLAEKYQQLTISENSFIEWLQSVLGDTFVSVNGQTLSLSDGMSIRLITDSFYSQVLEDAQEREVSIIAQIEENIREVNIGSFKRKYEKEIALVSSEYPAHTNSDTDLLLKLIGRVNPDLSLWLQGGLARLDNSQIILMWMTGAQNTNTSQVYKEISIVWKYYHTQIVASSEINSFIASVNEEKVQNSDLIASERVPDINRQIRGIFFILKGFISRTEDLTHFEVQLVKNRILESDIIPSIEQIDAAEMNYRIFKQLRKQGIIPAEWGLEPGDILTMEDFRTYLNDIATYMGIDDITMSIPKSLWFNLNKDIAQQSLWQYFHFMRSATSTLCMQSVRSGLSKLTGVSIAGIGDVKDIIASPTNTYSAATKIENMFRNQGAKDKFHGYIPDFWKEHFMAPSGANMGMIFTDTRSADGSRWGHVAALILAPDGRWLVQDPYYKWPLGALKTVQDYLSIRNPGLVLKHGLHKDPSKIKWAVFFRGDLQKIAFSPNKSTPIVASWEKVR